MKFLFFLFLFSPVFIISQVDKNHWDLFIENDLGRWIPLRMALENSDGQEYLNLINASENIRLKSTKKVGDTLIFSFIDYNAEIGIAGESNGYGLTGYWINYEKTPTKRRKIKAEKPIGIENFVVENISQIDIAGEWRTIVSLPDRSYDAILYIINDGINRITGTMRTRSGDYRYLEGELDGNNFYLSTFNGSSLFYLSGSMYQDTIKGKISGISDNNRTITAFKDDSFKLPSSESITNIVNDLPFNLSLQDETGKIQNFENLIKDKVSIVSIFGTWCPNCVDEVDYLQKFKNKYPDVQIVMVAFEATDQVEEQKKRVAGFKARKKIDLKFLIGGNLKKENLSDKFPMVDNINAYPTMFILNKKGEIVEVYTGFNGPATGVHFISFKENFENKINRLLSE